MLWSLITKPGTRLRVISPQTLGEALHGQVESSSGTTGITNADAPCKPDSYPHKGGEDDAKGGIRSEHSAPAHILALVRALHAREVLAEAIWHDQEEIDPCHTWVSELKKDVQIPLGSPARWRCLSMMWNMETTELYNIYIYILDLQMYLKFVKMYSWYAIQTCSLNRAVAKMYSSENMNWTFPKHTLLDAQASSTYKIKRHRNWSAKRTKMCKTMQNVHPPKKKHFFGCPGKLHFQNAQTLECEEHKNVQNHAKCAQIKKETPFWMPRQAPLTKRTEIRVQKAQQNMQNHAKCAQIKTKTYLDAQASSTYKTHRNWSAKNPKMCTKKITCVDGCPGKLHLQNAQNLECEEHKNVQNHAKCAQIKNQNFFGCPGKLHLQNAQKLECKKPKNVYKKNHLCVWMPRQAPLTKRTELGV